MQITRVVITGAPCSGKTSIINKAAEHYRALGIHTVLCPETATLVLEGGFDRSDAPAFELEIARAQQEAERRIDEQLSALDCDRALVLFDRGISDCYSYVDDREAFERAVGIPVCSTWARYDAVIMLETLAVSGVIENSDIRIESVEQALRNHEALLDVYVGHPHLRYISVCDTEEQKLGRVISEIDMLLNNVELEKKFLIEYPDIDALSAYKPFMSDISQTYLLCSRGSHRVRKRTTNGIDTYFETIKYRITGSRAEEYDGIISEDRYNELMKLADPDKSTINKKRYCFLYEGQYFELDLFSFWDDKALLELELTSEEEQVKLPPELKLISDVSDDAKYKNNYLARLKL